MSAPLGLGRRLSDRLPVTVRQRAAECDDVMELCDQMVVLDKFSLFISRVLGDHASAHPRRLAGSTRYWETGKTSQVAVRHACHSILLRLRTLILHYVS